MKLLTLGLVLALATPALAEDMTIDMLNKRDDGAKMVYSEDIARIDVGDTSRCLAHRMYMNTPYSI